MSETSISKLPHTEQAASDQVDLHRYWGVIRKRLWVLVAVVAVGVTAAVLYTMRQPKVYEATASMIINPKAPQVLEGREIIQLGTGGFWSNQDYYNTQVGVLRSQKLARRTVVHFGLHKDPRLVGEKSTQSDGEQLSEDELVAAASATLQGAITASQDYESWIVNIHVRHTDTELAKTLADKHRQMFIEYQREMRRIGSRKAEEYLSAEIDKAKKRVTKAEEARYSFERENDLLAEGADTKLDTITERIVSHERTRSEAKRKRERLQDMLYQARKALKMPNIRESPIFGISPDGSDLSKLRESHTDSVHELAELEMDLGKNHDKVVRQAAKVAKLESLMRSEARRVVSELEAQYAIAYGEEKRNKAGLKRNRHEAMRIKGLKAKKSLYSTLLRTLETESENLKRLTKRKQDASLAQRNEQINVREHDDASAARLVSPNMKANLAVAFLLSALFGIGLVFFLDQLDRTIKSTEDVEETVGVPLLGVIPIVDTGAKADLAAMKTRDLWVHDNPTSQAAECCRSIRTNILFMTADKEVKTFTISSPKPREGKTTSTIYMGTIMAQNGQRTLLIDTDMRRPRLHKSMGVSRTRGVTNLIMGDCPIEEAVKETDIPNLFVLPCGPQPPNPAELLHTARFAELLEELKGRYDRIILDSPPVLAVTDAVVLARLSDGVIMVAQAGKTDREDAAHAVRQLRGVDARILGVILNDMDLSSKRYGYYYYYNYAYREDPNEAAQEAAKDALSA